MKHLLTSAAFVTVLAAPAFAGGVAEPIIEAPVIAPIVTAPVSLGWGGAYGGAAIGGGTFGLDNPANDDDDDDDDDGDDDNAFEEVFDGVDEDNSGFAYSAHAGYNVQRGAFVFGPEVAIFGGGGDINTDIDDDTGNDLGTEKAEINYGGRLVGRAGYDFGGRTLVYGTLGLAYLDVDAGDEDLSDTGLAAGLGVSYKVTERVALGAEYNYHGFNDFDDTDADIDYNTLSLKMSVGF